MHKAWNNLRDDDVYRLMPTEIRGTRKPIMKTVIKLTSVAFVFTVLALVGVSVTGGCARTDAGTPPPPATLDNKPKPVATVPPNVQIGPPKTP